MCQEIEVKVQKTTFALILNVKHLFVHESIRETIDEEPYFGELHKWGDGYRLKRWVYVPKTNPKDRRELQFSALYWTNRIYPSIKEAERMLGEELTNLVLTNVIRDSWDMRRIRTDLTD